MSWRDRATPAAEGGWRSRATKLPTEADATIAAEKKFAEEQGGPVNFLNSMVRGSSIAENFPGGSTLADVGSSIGTGIAALTTTEPGDDYLSRLGQNYDQAAGGMQRADAERAAIDARSPVAVGTKEILAEIAPMALKTAPAPAPQVQTPSMQDELNRFLKQKYGKNTGYTPDAIPDYVTPSSGSQGQSILSQTLKKGENFLDPKTRMALWLARRIGGKP